MRKFLRIWTQKRKNGSRYTQEKSKSGQVSILGNSAPVPLGAGAVTVTTKIQEVIRCHPSMHITPSGK